MRRLVTIDLKAADVVAFEAYEAKVLPLLARHGGRLETRVRALDGTSETHLIFFPNIQAFEAYRDDPDRMAVRSEWDESGAVSVVVEVETIG